MQNEIPAGTKVKVAMTSKGAISIRDAEVLAHMDGLVHVDMDGQAVSIDPSQIVPADAPADPPPPVADSAPTPLPVSVNDETLAEVVERTKKDFVPLLETAAARFDQILQPFVDRLTAVENDVRQIMLATISPPVSADPAPTETQPTESTTVAESGEPAAGS